MSRAQVVALEYFGRYRVDAVTKTTESRCPWLVLIETRQEKARPGPGWLLVARERRSTNDDEVTAIYRRVAG
jgi:hypothetical protein